MVMGACIRSLLGWYMIGEGTGNWLTDWNTGWGMDGYCGTSCLLICVPLSLLFTTFRHVVSSSHGWFHLQFQTLSLLANRGGNQRGGRTVSSQLIRVLCSYKCVPHGSSVLPNVISGSLAWYEAFPKVSGWSAQLDCSLGGDRGWCDNVPLNRASRAPDGGNFQILPLIMVNSGRKTKPENKVVVTFLGNCLSWLVSCSIGVGIACEMVHHNEDIFVPSSTLLQMKEVNGN